MPPDNTIDQSFVKEYETEVKVAYQREGSLLGNTIRTKKNVKGSSARFQKYGQITAVQKTRNGDLNFQNPDHSYVDVNLEDWYAPIQVDDLDELATNNDERQLAASAGAMALGREQDQMIIDAAATTANVVGDYSSGVTLALISQGTEMLDNFKVPSKDRFGILRPHAFNELRNLSKVSSRDYTGDLMPWLKGEESFYWNFVTWIKHSGLPLADTDNGDSFLYHKSAIGFASGKDVSTRIDWDTRAQAHNIVSTMKGNAVVIEGNGVVKLKFDDDTPLAA
ncbi:MAG: phage capsid protein [bacterium]|nr:phage capsid protein [bacterium]